MTVRHNDSGREQATFPIVGIGASAGGLKAFEAFFRQMPSDSGMAFVLVQHLDPTHDSILVDLIKRVTAMDVFEAEDGLQVQPNTIYIIPPNRDISLLHGTLHLVEPAQQRGHRLPIDFLFRSLAEDQREKAICIILSGTGRDGTLGLKEIRGAGGMAMVQTPESAQYDGMPQSAIATGQVDYILPPEAMPDQLIRYTHHFHVSTIKDIGLALPEESDSLEKIFILLRRKTKHDFSLYKHNTIRRRIERRMIVNQIERLEDYIRYLNQTPLEIDILFQEMLIGVTSFFRDQEAFEALTENAISKIILNRQNNQPIRVWIPGCSTGEEVYSIAILLQEQMGLHEKEFEVQIFATDIDDQSLSKARLGIYSDNIVSNISAARLHRFFKKEGNAYQISQRIREMVVFAVQSIIKDPPFSRLDLISCRNLLIYLRPELQRRVIPLFHYALIPNGFLFLGTSETLGEFSTYFTVIDRKAKLFQRLKGEAISPRILDFTIPSQPQKDTTRPKAGLDDKELSVKQLTEKLLLQQYAPSGVVIDEKNEILYFHGKTSTYLEPASGDASLNILRMAREGLRLPLTIAIREAFAHHKEVVQQNVQVETSAVTLTVRPIVQSTSTQRLLMITFDGELLPSQPTSDEAVEEDLDESDQRLVAAEQELQLTRDYLQTTIEELETTNEEMKSSNEELQSANEELQSSNEELETTKEELQSVNEELITLNSELQSTITELTQSNNDLKNLLVNIEVGVIFLDIGLHIKRFNPSATQLINLIDSDIGRPMSHIMPNLASGDLVQDAQAVLNTLIPKEIESQTKDQRWFLIRIRPYRTVNNVIEGLVITFTDITIQKKAELSLRAARDYTENIIATIRQPLLVLDEQLRIISANHAFYQLFKTKPALTENMLIYELGNHQWRIPELQELLENILPMNETFEDFRVEHDFPEIGHRTMLLNGRQMHGITGENQMILLVLEDITWEAVNPHKRYD
jgi:two-component system CheB/CheR fusion protein